jgi:membrane protease YdiL (CAAX protease family)
MKASSRKPSFSVKHPILYVIIAELLLLFAVGAAGAYATMNQLSYTAPVLISFIPIAITFILYLTLKKKWREIGFKSLSSIPGSHLRYYFPLVIVLAIIIVNGFKSLTVGEISFFLFFTLLVGFVEETLYRGIMFRALLQKSKVAAVATTSVLFSITHLLNALSGQSWSQLVLQLFYALLVGVTLSLLILKNDNILPLIAFHFIHNLLQFLGNEQTNMIGDILIITVLLGQCIWLLVSMRTPVATTNRDQLTIV